MRSKNSLIAGWALAMLLVTVAATAAEEPIKVIPGPDGKPAAIGYDLHKDGKPDHWVYVKDGKIFKREWDRNFDGRPDFRTFESDGLLLEKQYDDNFDGQFEKKTKFPKVNPAKQTRLASN